MTQDLRFFIGWDSREPIAYDVAKASLLANTNEDVSVSPIKLDELVKQGLYTRDVDPLASTEFTYSRFFTPLLADFKGWAIFCDCDFLFFSDVANLRQYMRDDIAVACVKHDYTPTATTKMDGKAQTVYPRKNWSSFMIFNCDHPSTQKLTQQLINTESGAYLHRMQWAQDNEIGDVPTNWNWLEGWNEKPATGYPNAVHFTNGGPWFKDWQDVDYAQEWRDWADKVDSNWKPI
ncbi:hypothetical protein [Ahrensia sp. 13_GOM-1096m]|uniref:hypothetical protein n=1 Tax=Ahrensia sp. 13_GOM-1096m TaxID=1380380 RepID=UPI00047E97C7|nr:hypothetical protein [Ahrensia sp. 13_GOM-1096m]